MIYVVEKGKPMNNKCPSKNKFLMLGFLLLVVAQKYVFLSFLFSLDGWIHISNITLLYFVSLIFFIISWRRIAKNKNEKSKNE